jgi:hypothetical protein
VAELTDLPIFEIDLNMLRGNEITSHIDFMVNPRGRNFLPQAGQTVWAIDEDDTHHMAIIESVTTAGFVNLRFIHE